MSGTVVTAAAAPLWEREDAAARIGAFTAVDYNSYVAWMGDLVDRRVSLIGALSTVAIGGEPVEVLGETPGGLLQVRLPAQPDGDGNYTGFVASEHVGRDARRRVTHRVVADVGSGQGPGPSLAAGTTVELETDAAADVIAPEKSDVRVVLASGETVSCPGSSLRDVRESLGALDVLDIARGFVGSPYVWGGVGQPGIDCSGLVHMSARLAGHRLPRDAHHQWAQTQVSTRWEDVERGDILFFGEGATLDGVDHVGFYVGEDLMLHAPEEGRTVAIEPLSATARDRYVGAGRLQPPRTDRKNLS